MRGIIVLGA